jgi:hypothetical protein
MTLRFSTTYMIERKPEGIYGDSAYDTDEIS